MTSLFTSAQQRISTYLLCVKLRTKVDRLTPFRGSSSTDNTISLYYPSPFSNLRATKEYDSYILLWTALKHRLALIIST